ncbi:MAG: hypothetical protein LBQ97_08410 [Fusobacteriaceae bacterium]|jgi:hypothetical protein|nr:hypothetical protein [Fusobacteriaceae bacterium]
MEFVQVLKEKYGENTPILIDEIKAVCGNYSRPRISQFIDEAIRKRELIRYSPGVYYLPTMLRYGLSMIGPRDVIEKKYITNGAEIYGYYSGFTLLNAAGLTTQVPNTLEIVSNNVNSRLSRVLVDYQKVIVRRARAKITSENYQILRFLELVNNLESKELKQKEFLRYVRKINLKRGDIQQYIEYYPKSVGMKLIESEVIYEFARSHSALRTDALSGFRAKP